MPLRSMYPVLEGPTAFPFGNVVYCTCAGMVTPLTVPPLTKLDRQVTSSIRATEPKGALGLMQLMPETAEQFHLDDPFNAEQNLRAGAEYLKQLLDRFHGDLKLTLAAYNAGPARVEEGGAVPDIPETQDYVSQILKALAGAAPLVPDKGK